MPVDVAFTVMCSVCIVFFLFRMTWSVLSFKCKFNENKKKAKNSENNDVLLLL